MQRPVMGFWFSKNQIFQKCLWQVPGGTIDAGEGPETAATREFIEETGLPETVKMDFLCIDNHRFERDGKQYQVKRHYFHTQLSDDTPQTWDHHEIFAHDGADPILFRFCWKSLSQAKQELGVGMNAAIDELAKRLAETP